ncbi:hypothetical protein F66182_16234, partial [Fusarium sp. NRRL 66182]
MEYVSQIPVDHRSVLDQASETIRDVPENALPTNKTELWASASMCIFVLVKLLLKLAVYYFLTMYEACEWLRGSKSPKNQSGLVYDLNLTVVL